jgi:hypothetical protein
MNNTNNPNIEKLLLESEQLASFVRKFQTDEEFARAFYAEGNKYGDYSTDALNTLLELRKTNTQTQIIKS